MARRAVDLQALIMAFQIGPTYGGFKVRPHAQPDDGLLPSVTYTGRQQHSHLLALFGLARALEKARQLPHHEEPS